MIHSDKKMDMGNRLTKWRILRTTTEIKASCPHVYSVSFARHSLRYLLSLVVEICGSKNSIHTDHRTMRFSHLSKSSCRNQIEIHSVVSLVSLIFVSLMSGSSDSFVLHIDNYWNPLKHIHTRSAYRPPIFDQIEIHKRTTRTREDATLRVEREKISRTWSYYFTRSHIERLVL